MAGKKSTPIIKVAGTLPTRGNSGAKVIVASDEQKTQKQPLSNKEMQARREFKKVATSAGGFNSRTAYGEYMTGDVSMGTGGNWYSPQLSTDFLEKPQNQRERRSWYRHFYHSNEIVGASIDMHSTIPLSKIRLQKPKAQNKDLAEYSHRFFSDMVNDLKLLKSLMEISHEYWMFGNAVCLAEVHDPYQGLDQTAKDALLAKGKARSDMLLKEFGIKDKDPNFKGWTKLTILPPDQVTITRVPFAEEALIQYIPDSETRSALTRQRDTMGEAFSELSSVSQPNVPNHILEAINSGGGIPLERDPNQGTFAYHFARKKSQYEVWGTSILERCINTLLLKDKLRQAQTSIASRHMTPIRVVWAEELSDTDVEDLRTQVDMSLMDPDYSIVANYQVNWDEYGSNQRLLELTTEYDHQDSDLYAGLGVTREMLTGESSYSGSKLSLELLNLQYMMFREFMQDYVEKYLFEPIAKRKGFVEHDKYGNEVYIYPKLTFSRMSIRDTDSVFDQVFQLYQKGSLPIDTIYELLGLDPDAARDQLEKDLFTVNDAAFNDLLRAAYQTAANGLLENSNLVQRTAESLNLEYNAPEEGGGDGEGGDSGGGLGGLRFASKGMKDILKAANEDPSIINEFQEFLKKRGGPGVKVNGKI